MNSAPANRAYPPLPKPAHVEYEQGFVHDIEHPYFSAEQMHAYLDDGWAMRAISTPENYRADLHGSECYDERCAGCIATPQPAALDVLRSFAEGRSQHINKGLCPDHIAGHGSRDPECAICRAIDQQGGA